MEKLDLPYPKHYDENKYKAAGIGLGFAVVILYSLIVMILSAMVSTKPSGPILRKGMKLPDYSGQGSPSGNNVAGQVIVGLVCGLLGIWCYFYPLVWSQLFYKGYEWDQFESTYSAQRNLENGAIYFA